MFSGKRDKRLNKLWHCQSYILSHQNSFNRDFLEKHKHIVEIEHQVGRYLNMRSICDEIIANKYDGDIVEFGIWQGLSLIFLANMFKDEQKKRKFIGIDSFKGLPISSTVWKKGNFKDTSLDTALRNIELNSNECVHLIKGWFSDTAVIHRLKTLSNDIILVHFDSDLGSSTKEALDIIKSYLIDRKKPVYFLFDDWGCYPDEVPDAFFNWLDANKKLDIRVERISSTRYTRYYKITI